MKYAESAKGFLEHFFSLPLLVEFFLSKGLDWVELVKEN